MQQLNWFLKRMFDAPRGRFPAYALGDQILRNVTPSSEIIKEYGHGPGFLILGPRWSFLSCGDHSPQVHTLSGLLAAALLAGFTTQVPPLEIRPSTSALSVLGGSAIYQSVIIMLRHIIGVIRSAAGAAITHRRNSHPRSVALLRR